MVAFEVVSQERGIPKTPFILLTGWGGQALEKEKAIESGVDAVVEKPLDSKKFIATIREVVERVIPEESK